MRTRFMLAFFSVLLFTANAIAVTVDWTSSYYPGHRLIRLTEATDGPGHMLAGYAWCRSGEYPNYEYFNELVMTRTDEVGNELFYTRTRFAYDPVPRDVIGLDGGGYLVAGAVGNNPFASSYRSDEGLFIATFNEAGELITDAVYPLNMPAGSTVGRAIALSDGGMIAVAISPSFYDSATGQYSTTQVLVRIDSSGNMVFRNEYIIPASHLPELVDARDGSFWFVGLATKRIYNENVYLASSCSYILRKIDGMGGELVSTVTPVDLDLDYASAALTPEGGLLIHDRWEYTTDQPTRSTAVSKFDAQGNFLAMDWVPDTSDAHNVQLIALLDGSYYVLTSRRGYSDVLRLMKMDASGRLVWDYLDTNKFSYVSPMDKIHEADGNLLVLASILGSGLFHFDIGKTAPPPPPPPPLPNPNGITVALDVLPGSDNNKVNPKKNGVLPVAILSAPGFDAATLDPGTVAVSGMLPKYAGDELFFLLKDVNKDGLEDMILHMDVSTLEASGDSELVLTGCTVNGESVTGSDEVVLKDK